MRLKRKNQRLNDDQSDDDELFSDEITSGDNKKEYKEIGSYKESTDIENGVEVKESANLFVDKSIDLSYVNAMSIIMSDDSTLFTTSFLSPSQNIDNHSAVTLDDLLLLTSQYCSISILSLLLPLLNNQSEDSHIPQLDDNVTNINTNYEVNPIWYSLCHLIVQTRYKYSVKRRLRKITDIYKPLIIAIQHSHIDTLQLYCQHIPYYLYHFLRSKTVLHKAVVPAEDASEKSDTNLLNEVEVKEEEDIGQTPCILFQMTENEYNNILCTLLHSLDRVLSSHQLSSTGKADKSSRADKSKRAKIDLRPPLTPTHALTHHYSPLKTRDMLNLIRLVDPADGSTIAHWAAESNNYICLEHIFYLDPTLLRAMDQSGLTPLHCACMMGSSECVSVLLRAVPDFKGTTDLIMAPDNTGWSAFLYAVCREQVACAMLLLQRSSYSTTSTTDGNNTSSSSSSEKGHNSDPSAVIGETYSDVFEKYDISRAVSQLEVSNLLFLYTKIYAYLYANIHITYISHIFLYYSY